MGIKRLLFLSIITCLCMILAHAGFAQKNWTDTLEVKEINGKKYYLHTVVKGDTPYNISVRYKVVVSDIYLANPDAIDGIKIGQVLRIPVLAVKDEPVVEENYDDDELEEDENFYIHKVKRKQTVYGLSRKYDVTTDQIYDANPGLREEGLKVGGSIRIPKKKLQSDNGVELSPGFLQHVKAIKDSLRKADTTMIADPNSIPVDTLIKKDSYKIAFMLPLYLEINDSLIKLNEESETNEIYEKSQTALEFFEGARLALDSLVGLGLNAEIFVYDTEGDTGKVKELLKDSALKELDLIIGPFYRVNLELVADFAGKHHIHVVSPFSQHVSILKDHGNVSKTVPASGAQMQQVAAYIADRYANDNIILVYNDAPGDKELFVMFQSRIEKLLLLENDSTSIKLTEVKYPVKEIAGVVQSLSLKDTNIVVFLTEDQADVSDLITRLNPMIEKHNIILFGLPKWKRYEEGIEANYLHNLRIHVPVPTHVDFNNEGILNFMEHYTKEFGSEPNYPAFALQGFDIAFYYGSMLKKHGANFQFKLMKEKWQGLHTGFKFVKLGLYDGYENRYTGIYEYRGFEQVKVD